MPPSLAAQLIMAEVARVLFDNVAELSQAAFDVVGGKAVIIAAWWECGKGGEGRDINGFQKCCSIIGGES